MNGRKKGACAAALALCAIVAAPLGAQRKVDAGEAVALAIASDEGLKQAAIALEAKGRALGLAWNALLPTVAASAGLSAAGDAATASSANLAATGGLSATLTLSASFGDSRRLARLEYESQALAYEKAKAQLELSIRKEVCAILLDEEKLKLAKQNIERESASYAQTEAKYKAGLASELDLLSAKVSLESLKPTAEGYATTLANDLDGLKSGLGLAAEEELEVSGGLEAEDAAIARLLEAAKAQREEDNRSVATAAKSLEIAKLSKSSLRSSKLLPSLALSASAAPSLPLAGSSASSTSASAAIAASAVVSLSLDNYLPGSAAQQAIAEAQDAVDTAESALKAALKATRVARKSDARSVEAYRGSLAALKLNVDLAERAYEASKTAYDKGYATLTALQSAAGELDSAKLSALSKSYDLIAAILELEYETGLGLDTIGRF